MPHRVANAMLLLAVAACAGTASARTSDRNQPMDAESDRNTCDLGDGGQCVLTGKVRITQGSLGIDAGKAVIYRANGDISRAVFTGGPVQLKQLMDDGTPMSARANAVDYNLKTEVVVFTGDVSIQQPSGSLSGQHIVYNLKTSSINGGGEGNGRVKMRIVPSGNKSAKPTTDAPAATESKVPAAAEPAAAEKDTN